MLCLLNTETQLLTIHSQRLASLTSRQTEPGWMFRA